MKKIFNQLKTDDKDKLYKKDLQQGEHPFDEDDPGYSNANWIKPKLVGEFRFTEWTSDNKLRHPSFRGLRDDKKATDVRKEVPGS